MFLFVVGFAQMAYTALNQSFLQHRIAEDMRGRVLSLLTLTTFGLQPFGAMIAGSLAAAVGPQVALVLEGLRLRTGGDGGADPLAADADASVGGLP